MPALMMGADGGTLSTAGVAPEAIMNIYHATQNSYQPSQSLIPSSSASLSHSAKAISQADIQAIAQRVSEALH